MRVSAPALSESEPATPHDVDTPVDDIPIDPALMASPDKQIIYQEPNGFIHQIYEQLPVNSMQHYSQGPQGDPFAPQPPQIYFPPPEPDPQPSQKPIKRKRKSRRERTCDFCQAISNKDGQPETMLSCVDCGASAHPGCLPPLRYISVETQLSNPWKCAACKSCEICGGKENDQDLLLCDGCDRGWHRSCLDPPMDETPEGDWFCSECSQNNPHLNGHYDDTHNQNGSAEIIPTPSPRAPSVASSSRSQITQTSSKMAAMAQPRKRGPGRPPRVKPPPPVAAATDDDEEMDVGVSAETPSRRTRTKTKIQPSQKGKGRAVDQSDDDLVTPSSTRQPKRMRFRQQSPAQPSPIPRVRLRLPQKGKGKGKEREEDETKGMFDDVLGEDERDTSKSVILQSDKQRFERSRAVAEEALAPRPPRFSEIPDDEQPVAGPSSRPLRSSTIAHMPLSTSSKSPAPSTPGGPINATHNTNPPSLRIRLIRIGAYEIKTWYDAPFPEEYANIPDGRLWICEFCLKYMKSKFGAVRHQMKCKAKHPPGDEIYRDGVVSIFEVDGRKNKIYCQNLCLLSKMYLDHKSLFYDVEPFLFYVMTEVDDRGARFVGYFSKEKRSPKDYNVSCIMTLPARQRQGWGNLLIDFSYLLSKKEQRTGSPEKPLSALGALGYKKYWTLSLMRYLETAPENTRLEDISAATSMTIEDIYNTLVQQNMITSRPVTPPSVRPSPGQSIKYIKGRRGGGSIARRNLQRTLTNTSLIADDDKSSILSAGVDKTHHQPKGPFIAPKEYEITWDPEVVQSYMRNWEAKGYLRLRPEKLKWSPFLVVKAGAAGEVGVVKKTEATGATGTGGAISTSVQSKLSVLTTNVLGGLENGNGRGERERGSDTPLSLFDDDNVVSAAEMEVPNLSATPAKKPMLSDAEERRPSSVNGTGRATRSRSSGTPMAKEDRGSPSPSKRRKKHTKSSEAAEDDEAASISVVDETLANAQDLELAQARRGTKRNGVAHVDPDPDPIEDGYVRTRSRSMKKGKKCGNEDEAGTKEEEEEAKVDASPERKKTSTKSSTNPPNRTFSQPRLRGRFVKMPQNVAPSPPPSLHVDEQPDTPTPRQLRNRAVTVASGDSPLQGEPQRANSVNGRRTVSPRKRKRIDSSPEPEPDAVSMIEPTPHPSEPSVVDEVSEEATAATSLLSLLHSKPVVFTGSDPEPDHDENVKVEDREMNLASRNSIPSDVTVFGTGGTVVKADEQMDVDIPPTVPVDDEYAEDDGEYDLDDEELQ